MNPRPFKFRVWNLVEKQWDNPAILEVWDQSGTFRVMYKDEDYYIQQYTGMNDLTGKEIYEGDIVETSYENKIGEIYYDMEIPAFRVKFEKLSMPMTTYKFIEEDYTPRGKITTVTKVIGNIFENKTK